jgi:uncharacterized protein YpuA (DUF1002 family)
LLQEIIKPTNNQYTINIPDNYINQDIKFIMFPLVDDTIDETHCLDTLRKIENNELEDFQSVEPQELFKELNL